MRAAAACLAAFACAGLCPADEKPKLTLEITAPKEVYPDERVVVKAEIYNGGKDDAHAVRAIDGSFDGLRSVVSYRWVVKSNGKLVPRRTDVVRIDNHVNALRDEDVLAVKAGKSADLQVEGFGRFENFYDLKEPGKYTVVLRYELDPTGREKGSDAANKLVAKQPAVELESKAVEVTVLPWPAALAAAADKVKAAEAKVQIVKQFAETVAKNPNATPAERDAAGERLKRAQAALDEAVAGHVAKLAEFSRKREEDRKRK